ncbi:MAG: TatD family hydrolase [Acidimicrobiia bacterium]
MGWVDTHCHLQLDQRDPAALLQRAPHVDWVVAPGVDLESSKASLELASHHPGRILPTVGLHPHEAELWPDIEEEMSELATVATAIGETGLDYYRELAPRQSQRASFQAQIDLASTLGKPLIVHCRDAFKDVFDMVEDGGAGANTVLHCWTGGPKWTKRFLDLGVIFSFAGPLAFETGETVRFGAAEVPPGRAMVETDTPYLAPPPHRGEPNEPGWVSLVGEALAAVWGMSAQEVATVTSSTASRVFGR